MTVWYYGFMVLCFYDLWLCCFMVLQFHSCLVLQLYGLWFFMVYSFMVLWFMVSQLDKIPISCFQEDIDLMTKIPKLFVKGSSSFVGARLFQIWSNMSRFWIYRILRFRKIIFSNVHMFSYIFEVIWYILNAEIRVPRGSTILKS